MKILVLKSKEGLLSTLLVSFLSNAFALEREYLPGERRVNFASEPRYAPSSQDDSWLVTIPEEERQAAVKTIQPGDPIYYKKLVAVLAPWKTFRENFGRWNQYDIDECIAKLRKAVELQKFQARDLSNPRSERAIDLAERYISIFEEIKRGKLTLDYLNHNSVDTLDECWENISSEKEKLDALNKRYVIAPFYVVEAKVNFEIGDLFNRITENSERIEQLKKEHEEIQRQQEIQRAVKATVADEGSDESETSSDW